MSALLRGLVGRAAPLRPPFTIARARLNSKASDSEIGPAASLFALTLFSAVILIPGSWFLSHVNDYKKRE